MTPINQEFKDYLLAATWEAEAAEVQMRARMDAAHAELGPTKIPAKSTWRASKKK
jgi:hypothetical protein